MSKLMIVVTVPSDMVDRMLDAIAGAGGGTLGNYTHCSFTSTGTGHFKPSAQAKPHIGAKEEINAVDEVRIETFCERSIGKQVVSAIRQAHPYEEPVIYVIPVLDESEL